MPLLKALLSQTNKRALSSAVLPSPRTLPPLYNKSVLKGEFTIVEETGDLSNPTTAIAALTGGSVAITRNGVTLCTANNFTFAGNKMSFSLTIESEIIDTLLDASDDESFINVLMEVRFQTAQEEDTVLREALPLFAVDADIAPAPAPTITFQDSSTISWSVAA